MTGLTSDSICCPTPDDKSNVCTSSTLIECVFGRGEYVKFCMSDGSPLFQLCERQDHGVPARPSFPSDKRRRERSFFNTYGVGMRNQEGVVRFYPNEMPLHDRDGFIYPRRRPRAEGRCDGGRSSGGGTRLPLSAKASLDRKTVAVCAQCNDRLNTKQAQYSREVVH